MDRRHSRQKARLLHRSEDLKRYRRIIAQKSAEKKRGISIHRFFLRQTGLEACTLREKFGSVC